MFRFETSGRGDAAVLALFGNLDALSADALKAEVVRLSESKTNIATVVVDMSALELLDSTGVGVLISLFKRMRTKNGSALFAGLEAQPREIFRLLRLERSLDLVATVDEALAKSMPK